jgi:hypothetical protein
MDVDVDGRTMSAPQHCGWWMGDSVGKRVVVYGSIDDRWFGCASEQQRRSGKVKKAREQNSLKYFQTLVWASVGGLGKERTPDLYDVDNDICEPKSYAAIVLFY